MLLLNPKHRFLPHLEYNAMLHLVCEATCQCYNKEIPATQKEKEKFIAGRVKSGHESVIEHVGFSVLLTTSRGITHELVRHRLAQYTQSSQRYIAYDHGVPFVMPEYVARHIPEGDYDLNGGTPFDKKTGEHVSVSGHPQVGIWLQAMSYAENFYAISRNTAGEEGKLLPPEYARDVLPNATAANITMTANMREWRHIFRLRVLGTTGRPHPEITRLLLPVLQEAKQRFPVFFADL